MVNRVMRIVTIAAAGAAMLLSGCAGGDRRGGAGESEEMTAEQIHAAMKGAWKVEAINATPVDAARTESVPTLEMHDDGRVGGGAGVNRWSAAIDEAALGVGDVKLGAVITTLMAGSPEAMELEQKFLAAIGSARKIDLEMLKTGVLRMTDVGGDEVLRFARAIP